MLSRLDDYERVLLADVVEHPHDEVLLHIYADWLLDRSDRSAQTRGEYIKLELALAKTNRRDENKELRWQAHDLWWNYGESWLGPLYDAVDHFIYERGRLVIEISERTFMAAGPEVILESPAWDLVSAIVFRSCSLDVLIYLRDLPRPAMLLDFEVPARSLVGGELEYLLEGDWWRGLHELSLSSNCIGDSGVQALAEWSGLESVRRLDLDNCWIGPDGAVALTRSLYLKQIEVLSLRDTWQGRYDHVHSLSDANEALRNRFGRRVKLA